MFDPLKFYCIKYSKRNKKQVIEANQTEVIQKYININKFCSHAFVFFVIDGWLSRDFNKKINHIRPMGGGWGWRVLIEGCVQ